jgi:hypothetical protein
MNGPQIPHNPPKTAGYVVRIIGGDYIDFTAGWTRVMGQENDLSQVHYFFSELAGAVTACITNATALRGLGPITIERVFAVPQTVLSHESRPLV